MVYVWNENFILFENETSTNAMLQWLTIHAYENRNLKKKGKNNSRSSRRLKFMSKSTKYVFMFGAWASDAELLPKIP